MNRPCLDLDLLAGRVAVGRLEPSEPVPAWASGDLVSITRTAEELSVVCAENAVPAGVRAERGFRALKVRGPLDFGLTGILAALAEPLARAGISLFAVSTYDTDYLLVKEDVLAATIHALRAAGHAVGDEDPGARNLPRFP